MKKYKLIKEYPSSDSLGTIITGSKEAMYSKGLGFRHYDWAHVETHPEYWEEVVEKDYEILEYSTNETLTSKQILTKDMEGWNEIIESTTFKIHSVKRLSDGEVFTVGDRISVSDIGISDTITEIVLADSVKWASNVVTKEIFLGCENDHQYILSSVNKPAPLDYEIISYFAKDNPKMITIKKRGGEIHDSYWKIHSVKRLSDGEVFTVGDKIKVRNHGSSKRLDEIVIKNEQSSFRDGIWFYYSMGCSHFENAIKVKQPIFLTHDGKDIFEGDKVWYVNKKNLYHDYIIAFPEVKFYSDINVHFLTEEAVEDYIEKNKVLFTTEDGKDIFAGDKVWWVNKKTFYSNYFVPSAPVTHFLNINAYFLTQEEAKEYIEKNKVLFTTEDGVDIKIGDTYYFVDTDDNLVHIQSAHVRSGLYTERAYFSTFETAQYYVIVNAKVLSIEEFWEFVSKPASNIVKQKQLKRLVKERLNLK